MATKMTREEAIKIVQSATVWTDEERDALAMLIPELAESEDERIRKHLIEIVETYWGKTNEPGKAADLAWLEKQKEQKPISISHCHEIEKPKPEWSEEDEEMLNSCISSIEESKENRYAYKETDGDTSYDREVDWLKSLRPSWKPSEEQMDALHRCVDYLHGEGSGYFDPINSLYEQLKKL